MSNNNINNTGDNKLCDQTTRRKICSLCERPATVCLCDSIPAVPLSTSTQIIILHHPHEQRHPLATVPVLNKCLKNCHIITGRRLRRGVSAVLDSLYDDAEENKPGQSVHAAFLFPDQTPSMEINEWKSSFGDADSNRFVLIAFDGTWKHAKEMVFASFPFVSKFATQVCLSYDVNVDGETIFSSALTLRKEPFGGCMCTMEAVARCLRILEPNGIEIESRLVEVLRTMVRFQASFIKPINRRPKLLKKCKDDEK
uniref:tRNA-uridine aminocarboxypropyltransferase 2 isoform X2 n=1 Tax=Erigeron canadensis TaxID=72917 RepID=UPI001CB9517F|nr:tRNA-uridine aminocarboxypropyltransferase 2 isoform X2 [Erigeron canadensis]